MFHYEIQSIVDKIPIKIVFITTESSGIGKTTAAAFLKEGAPVITTSRKQKNIDEAVNILSGNL